MFWLRAFLIATTALATLRFAAAADLPEYPLWPGNVPGEKGAFTEEKLERGKGAAAASIKSYTQVIKPTLTLYRPAKAMDTGAAIVIAPGGGYRMLAWEHEGTMVGEWLQSIGITGVLLKYRIPRRPDAPADAPPVAALQDAQRAISMTRHHAREWGIDPARIGMLGFSAGGHLTAWAATSSTQRAYTAIDDADKVSCRPDFAVLIYSGGMIDRNNREKLSPELRISNTTPPCFFALAYNDAGPFSGSMKMLEQLKEHGVSAEMHIYAAGGHGFGMRSSDKPHASWPKRCEEWMRTAGWLTPTVSPVAPGAKLKMLAEGFQFTEGPSTDAAGNVFFTDQPNDRILKWSTDGQISTFMQPCGRSNGLCFDKEGFLWACADEKNELWKMNIATKEKTIVARQFNGKRLNGPNDVWVLPNGSAYFTDPFYKRPYWTHAEPEQDKRGVYFVSAKGELKRVDDDYTQPNGIVGSADGKTLYVADISRKRTYTYDIQTDGSLRNRRLFCSMGSDGMTLDRQGNLYLTGKGVMVFNPFGRQIEQIDVPEPWTANVCFGGKDKKTLFITAGKRFYSLDMRVQGAGSQ